MTDKQNQDTVVKLDEMLLPRSRLIVPSTQSLQQRIITQARSLDQVKPSSNRLLPFNTLGLSRWFMPISCATAVIALFAVLINTLPLPNNSPTVMLVNQTTQPVTPVNEQAWQAYFLLEDELLLSGL